MDSVTQLALGAAVGHAVLGRRVGRRALVWGAVCGTLPDLDVLITYGDAVADFTLHRSWSHSLLVLTAAAPLVGWAIAKVHRRRGESVRGWTMLALWVFVTHVLLDCLTVYGTQILWPLTRAPESWSTVFVIDPTYTLPLLVGIGAAWVLAPRSPKRAARGNRWGLLLSSLYLVWTIGAKLYVDARVETYLTRAGIAHGPVLATPTPLNSLLWRVVVMADDHYYEGFYSVIADGEQVALTRHASRPELLAEIADTWPVRRLQWFTHGFYTVSREGDAVVVADLRMGAEPEYFFRFAVGDIRDGQVTPAQPSRLVGARPPIERLGWMWRRIWDRSAR